MPAPSFSTVTVSRGHDLRPGDTVEIQTLDERWWVRLWHAVLLKDPPCKIERFTIQEMTSDTGFKL